jgi:hypothetical protein
MSATGYSIPPRISSVADGAIGNHALAVREAYSDFQTLASVILNRMAPNPRP